MAATDQFYRNQRTLDVIFGVSSTAMLLTFIWMFAQDYSRPYKTEQRAFRDVEVAVNQRVALASLPRIQDFEQARKEVIEAKKQWEKNKPRIDELTAKLEELRPEREKLETTFQDVKAEFNSKLSLYNIAVEHHGPDSPDALSLLEQVTQLQEQLAAAKAERDAVVSKIRVLQQEKIALLKPLTDARSRLKKLTNDFESKIIAAFKARWTWGDTIRAMPILDAFASPVKPKQYTINDVPIDYNFKYVTRFDRCASCHVGIDKGAFSKEQLRALAGVSNQEAIRLHNAKVMLIRHRQALEDIGADLSNIPTPEDVTLKTIELTEERINEFCAHPRLDLFVANNSKHPADRFGCTSCHQGQGSATEFSLAAHTPNSSEAMKRWKEASSHGWDREAQHYWDFPMLPMRFIESSCIKCHHEVTDLITVDNRNEAPKLIRGYYLVREFGCFGCHEINGRKSGRPIGPDLRLEPNPPLSELTAAERNRILADKENPPGTLRKVGPSLYRIAEKTNESWVAKWLRSPRSFRPDTRMPHYYGVSNNRDDVLPDDYKKYPDNEIQAIVFYLFESSKEYLTEVAEHHDAKKYSDAQYQADKDLVESLTLLDPTTLTKRQKQELAAAKARIRLREAAPPVQPLVKGYQGNPNRGRHLFSVRGCLACHRHAGTEEPSEEFVEIPGQPPVSLPEIPSNATFGPDLSQIKAKLGRGPNRLESAAVWLANWIKDPAKHSPRTKMPAADLTDKEIVDVAAWLLQQEASNLGDDWEKIKVAPPDPVTLRRLADVYLTRQISEANIDLLKKGKLPKTVFDTLPPAEQELARSYNDVSVRYYVGKKAISRLGCFGCHDIPGFDDAKPIGTGLNDWGMKDAERLAFEDILAHVEENYFFVDDMKVIREDGSVGAHLFKKEESEHGTKVKRPYEKFYLDHLSHHDRIGFLHQKLLEPRSYDHNRIRGKNGEALKPWDDFLRMPQFRFARTRRKPLVQNLGESDEDFAKRKAKANAEYEALRWKEEAEAREAIMTFILGLVAEQVPLKSLAQPKGDRLAQVQGRKLLTQFNCGGCHQIRPGTYEFELNESSRKLLEQTAKFQKADLIRDHTFYDHHAWTGGDFAPAKGKLRAYGIPVRIGEGPFLRLKLDTTDSDPGENKFEIRLSQALRFYREEVDPKTKERRVVPVDLRAGGQLLQLRAADLIWPPPIALASEQTFAKFESQFGVFGGDFSYLLTRYLIQRYPEKYKEKFGDSNVARASAPPPLIGQGGRTQPEWLKEFLKNPAEHPVRNMVVLRMPRFNLSEREREQIVEYFVAVERLTNPRFHVPKVATAVSQQADLGSEYWREKTARYVQLLKATKAADGSGRSLYDQRVALLRPYWDEIGKEKTQELEKTTQTLKGYEERLKKAKEATAKAKSALDARLGELRKQKRTEKEIAADPQVLQLSAAYEAKKAAEESLDTAVNLWTARKERLESEVKGIAQGLLQKRWEQEEAYVVDAFRALTNTQLCAKCHQVGQQKVADPSQAGPNLDLAQRRLRPDWISHWVARPDRLITYSSVMPNYFERGNSLVGQHLLAGSARQQFLAVTDTLMNYQRVVRLPIIQRLIAHPGKMQSQGKKK